MISLFQKLSELVFSISLYLSTLSTSIEYSDSLLVLLFSFSSVSTSVICFVMAVNSSDFALCRSFNEKNDQSVTQWLKKLEWELKRHFSTEFIDSADFLQAVNLLLTDNTAVWAEITSLITELLKTSASTANTVMQFKMLFIQQYSNKVSEVSVVHFNSEIADLQQQKKETFLAYYKWTVDLLS